MIRPWARKNAEVFANALDGRGPRNSEVQQLVRFAESLCEAAVDPSPEFLRGLRAELMADASSVLVVTRKAERKFTEKAVVHPVRKRVAAATAAFVATAGMLSIVASSAQALPGEMLYPVKRGVESVEFTLHRTDAGRGSFELAQATERLAEAKALATQGDARSDDLIVSSLADFTTKASSGSESLFADYTDSGDDASIDKVTSFATASSAVLSDLSGTLSPDTASAFRKAASAVNELASQASLLCDECDPAKMSSLATTVASFVSDSGNQATTDSPNADGTAAETPASSPDESVSPIVSTPSGAPSVNLPPVPTPSQISDGTPLLGALLGDDDEVGLVPGLVGGLLE